MALPKAEGRGLRAALSSPQRPRSLPSPGGGPGGPIGLRTQSSAGQETICLLTLQVPTLISWTGRLEHGAEAPEADVSPGASWSMPGSATDPGWDSTCARDEPRPAQGQGSGRLLCQGPWATSSLTRSRESLFSYESQAWLSPPASPPPRGGPSALAGVTDAPAGSPWAGRTLGAWRARPRAWPPPRSPHCSSQTRWSSSLGPRPPSAPRPGAHLRTAGSSPPLLAKGQAGERRPQGQVHQTPLLNPDA